MKQHCKGPCKVLFSASFILTNRCCIDPQGTKSLLTSLWNFLARISDPCLGQLCRNTRRDQASLSNLITLLCLPRRCHHRFFHPLHNRLDKVHMLTDQLQHSDNSHRESRCHLISMDLKAKKSHKIVLKKYTERLKKTCVGLASKQGQQEHNPLLRIFLNSAKSYILSFLSHFDSTKQGSPSSFSSYMHLKLKLGVFLTVCIVAMVTYCATKLTSTCSPTQDICVISLLQHYWLRWPKTVFACAFADAKHAFNRTIILFSYSTPALYVLFSSITERSVLMPLVFYYKAMLEKVTTQRTQQFSAFSLLPKAPS